MGNWVQEIQWMNIALFVVQSASLLPPRLLPIKLYVVEILLRYQQAEPELWPGIQLPVEV